MTSTADPARTRRGRPGHSLDTLLDVAVAVEREGRSFTVVSVRVEQEARPMALGLATLGELPADAD